MLVVAIAAYLFVGLVVGIVGLIRADDPWEAWVDGAHPLFQVLISLIFWPIFVIDEAYYFVTHT